MATLIEQLRNETWDCPDHPVGEGVLTQVYRTNVIRGAGNGCDSCLTRFVSLLVAVLGVEVPKPRDPGPEIPMVRETTRAGAIYEKCRAIGKMIGKSVPPSTGFCLMLFEFNGRQLEWICNAQRPDMIKLLGEFQELLRKDTRP